MKGDPLVRQLLGLVEKCGQSRRTIATLSGVDAGTMRAWRKGHSPTLTTLKAAYNTLGYDLVARCRKTGKVVGE